MVVLVRITHPFVELNVWFGRVGALTHGAHEVRASIAELLLTELNYISVPRE